MLYSNQIGSCRILFCKGGAEADELDWIGELGDTNARGEETKGVFVSASYGRTS
jgi:hypothetical protein